MFRKDRCGFWNLSARWVGVKQWTKLSARIEKFSSWTASPLKNYSTDCNQQYVPAWTAACQTWSCAVDNSGRHFDLLCIIGRARVWSKEFFDWTWLWILFVFRAWKLSGNLVSTSRKTDLMSILYAAIRSNCLYCIVVQATSLSIDGILFDSLPAGNIE